MNKKSENLNKARYFLSIASERVRGAWKICQASNAVGESHQMGNVPSVVYLPDVPTRLKKNIYIKINK